MWFIDGLKTVQGERVDVYGQTTKYKPPYYKPTREHKAKLRSILIAKRLLQL